MLCRDCVPRFCSRPLHAMGEAIAAPSNHVLRDCVTVLYIGGTVAPFKGPRDKGKRYMRDLKFLTGATVGGSLFGPCFLAAQSHSFRVTTLVIIPLKHFCLFCFAVCAALRLFVLRCADKLFASSIMSEVQNHSPEWPKHRSENGGSPPTVAIVFCAMSMPTNDS
ncbi:unnamed protein product [Laminaria digitata]